MSEQRFALADESATLAFGSALAQVVGPGVIALSGDLGAGKTTLARGLLRGLGHTGRVKSPTYALLERYPDTRIPVSHVDLYRIADPQAVEELALRDCDTARELLLVEWPERAPQAFPAPDLWLCLEHAGAGRSLLARAASIEGARWLAAIASAS